MPERIDVIAAVCDELAQDRAEAAERRLARDYAFHSEEPRRRSYGPIEATRVFVRDGFIDRYAGSRLIFPPVLRVISIALPKAFPFDSHWRTAVTHAAYWEVGATIDHVVPVTLGGPDDASNWVTTSMARNFAKMNWTIEFLGWQLHPAGNLADWDGLLHWFLEYTASRPQLVAKGNLRLWHRAALHAFD